MRKYHREEKIQKVKNIIIIKRFTNYKISSVEKDSIYRKYQGMQKKNKRVYFYMLFYFLNILIILYYRRIL